MNETLLPPPAIRPADGRFGAGPSKVRAEHVAALVDAPEWGTSHRKAPVINLVKSIQSGLRELFSVPADYEIVIGNGGATAFWAVAATSLIRHWAQFAVFGEFGAKFAADVESAPWLNATAVKAPPGSLATVADSVTPGLGGGPDAYCYPQNETSTGVVSPIYPAADRKALALVDATSIAGAAPVDLHLVDAYYFSPQKCFGSDGGLWVAILSPRAIERAAELNTGRSRPHFSFLSLLSAIEASRKGQTVNTPAIGSLLLLDRQIRWMLAEGGLPAMSARAEAGAQTIQAWAESRDYTELFVADPAWRSPVVTTVDIAPEIPVAELSAQLRAAGIVDVDGYRGLGRNQLRIASFPAIDTGDIAAALASIDWLVERF